MRLTIQCLESVMPELTSLPPFLAIGIAKRAVRWLIWVFFIFVILIYLGIAKRFDLFNLFQSFKIATGPMPILK